MKLIIDRFEGDFAVCEKPDRTMINIPRCDLPPETKEGDVIIMQDGRITLDRPGTVRRKENIKRLMTGLWKKPEAKR